MSKYLTVLTLGLVLSAGMRSAQADLVNWLVTEWGSVYKNLERVEDKKYKEPRYGRPQQIAGTADHYYVATSDGCIYKDGTYRT